MQKIWQKYIFPNSNIYYVKIAPQLNTAILAEFGILFLLGLKFQSPTWTRRLKSNFSGIPRASRTCVPPINRPLSFKRRCAWCLVLGLGTWCLGLCFDLNKKFFSEAWQVEEEKNMEAIPALRWVAKFLIGCWCSPFQVTMV
jgi:hypothetical protein